MERIGRSQLLRITDAVAGLAGRSHDTAQRFSPVVDPNRSTCAVVVPQ
jgi:hypothetical protein